MSFRPHVHILAIGFRTLPSHDSNLCHKNDIRATYNSQVNMLPKLRQNMSLKWCHLFLYTAICHLWRKLQPESLCRPSAPTYAATRGIGLGCVHSRPHFRSPDTWPQVPVTSPQNTQTFLGSSLYAWAPAMKQRFSLEHKLMESWAILFITLISL